MSYIRIKETARIDYLNRRWRFERRQDHVIEWRSTDGTFEHITFTDAELQHLIARGELRLFDGNGRPPADPANVSRAHGQRGPSAADLEEADRKLVYVLAIHRAGLMRPDSCTQDWTRAIDEVWDEQARHWKRLRGAHTGEPVQKPCIKSVRNWVAQAGSPPNAGKLVSRHRHKGNYDDRVAPGAREIIDGLVQSTWMARPAISLTSFKDVVQGRIREYNAKAAARLAMPGLSAIRSSIAAFPADEVTKARHGEMAAFLKYGSAEAQADPEAPLDRVELDSTPADLFVTCSRTGLPLGRPTIVLCIDRCTRMVLGWFVTFEKPSILALMQCLRNAMLSKDYVAEMNETHGWNIRHPCETFGVPTELVLDRGAENVSGHVARFATRIGINRVHLMGGKKPWLKGCIERTIKTLSERLLHPARGTTFHNTLMRMDYDPAKDAVCTTDDLDWALHKYFIDIYPREERTSLGGARAIDVWRKLTRIHPVTSVGSIEEVDHLFGRTEEATPDPPCPLPPTCCSRRYSNLRPEKHSFRLRWSVRIRTACGSAHGPCANRPRSGGPVRSIRI